MPIRLIPPEIAETLTALNLKKGDRLIIWLNDGQIVMEPSKKKGR